MAHEIHKGKLWVADDGSWGTSDIIIVDTTDWTQNQWEWLEIQTMSGDPNIDAVQAIDEGDSGDAD